MVARTCRTLRERPLAARATVKSSVLSRTSEQVFEEFDRDACARLDTRWVTLLGDSFSYKLMEQT